MRLIADCGNTRIKLGIYHDYRLESYAHVAIESAAVGAFVTPWLQQIHECLLIPGARASSHIMTSWWSEHRAGQLLRYLGGNSDTDLPIPNLGQYNGCGLDRIVAGFAAGIQERQSVVVVDAGTATTITAWHVAAENSDPQHAIRFAGGLILPGMRACLKGLTIAAPALPLVEPLGPDAHAQQHDTANAIAAAMGIGYGPMVAACLLKLQRETNIHHAVVTGGDIQSLLDAQITQRESHRPTLVLDGMNAWCQQLHR